MNWSGDDFPYLSVRWGGFIWIIQNLPRVDKGGHGFIFNSIFFGRELHLRTNLIVKPAVIDGVMHFSDILFQPAGSICVDHIESRHIGLDVDHRCAVNDVMAADIEVIVFYPFKTHNRNPNRIGTLGRPCCKNPAQVLVQKRSVLKRFFFCKVHVKQNINVRKPL